MEGKNTTSRLRPYDQSMEENLSMYDYMPYERDTDLCNANHITLHSANMLKYYSYEINQSSYTIPNQDAIIQQRIDAMRQQLANEQSEPSDSDSDDTITEDQIKELVEDHEKRD